MSHTSLRRDARSVSEVYGTVLLISISLLTAMMIIGLGGTLLGSIVTDSENQITQDSMIEMDDRLSTISGSAVDASTSFTYPSFAGDELSTNPEEGTIEITAEATVDEEYLLAANGTSSSTSFTLGTVEHITDGGTAIAYQGGAVIQQQGDYSVLLSPPPLDFDGTQLSLGLLDVSDLESLNAGAETYAVKSTHKSESLNERLRETVEPYAVVGSDGEVHGTVPVNVTMAIETEYVDAWESHFTDELSTPITDDGVTVGESSVTVEFTLGDEFGVLRNDSFFEYEEPQTIYAGPSQFAQYHDDVEPVDGGPSFQTGEEINEEPVSITTYHPEFEEWVVFDGDSEWEGYNNEFDNNNDTHLDWLPLEEGEEEIARGVTDREDNDGYVYHFDDDALICLSGASELNSEQRAKDCAENMTEDPEEIINGDSPFPVSEFSPLSAEMSVIEFSG